jgi:hypothetical protein
MRIGLKQAACQIFSGKKTDRSGVPSVHLPRIETFAWQIFGAVEPKP